MGRVIYHQDIQKELQKIHASSKKIVLTGGCFDIIHSAHIEFLKRAKKEGDYLIVILESDESIRKYKGTDRPVNTQKDREKILSHLGMVDAVIPIPSFTQDSDYYTLVKTIKPAIIAITKGDSQTANKKAQAEMVGGELKEIMKRDSNFSSTKYAKNL